MQGRKYMNSINLIGNICNDVELKTTNSGKSVCSFNLAVKRPFSKETTDFLPVVCWERQGEMVSKYCKKGDRIGITGVMTSRKYQDKDGNNRTAFEVVANNVQFIESKRSQDNGEDNSLHTTDNDLLPELAERLEEFEDISGDGDDDLPF